VNEALPAQKMKEEREPPAALRSFISILLLFVFGWAAVSYLHSIKKDKPFPTILLFFESTKKEKKSCGMR